VAVVKPDYLSRDFAGLRRSLLTYAQQRFPEWQPGSQGDFGLVLVDMFAYMGDILSYYTDRAQFENYLPTATQRDSILNLAFMLGYLPNSGTPAKGTVPIIVNEGTGEVTVPAGLQIFTNRIEALDNPVAFEVDEDTVIPANPDPDGNPATPVEVAVTEGETVTFQYLGESTGRPSQSMVLPHTGVYRDTLQVFVEDGAGETLLNEGAANEVALHEWVMLDHLLEGDSGDKVFETKMSSTSAMSVLFGDDINGAIPATGLKVYASYRHGVGAGGNVGAGQIRLINSKGDPSLGRLQVVRDSNGAYLSTEATGGSDPESSESIRRNAPRVYRTQNRVVTEKDFVEVALGVEGVSTASCIVGTFTSVTLFLAGADGGPASDTVKQAVLDALEDKTLAGVEVTIGSQAIVPVNFGSDLDPIRIVVRKGYALKNVRAAARRAIRKLVGGLAFGDSLGVNQVYEVLNKIKGVKKVDIDVMARADDVQTGAARITPRDWEYLTVGTIYLNVVRVASNKDN
jgi:uncharacterized phage protein gp47/JayE